MILPNHQLPSPMQRRRYQHPSVIIFGLWRVDELCGLGHLVVLEPARGSRIAEVNVAIIIVALFAVAGSRAVVTVKGVLGFGLGLVVLFRLAVTVGVSNALAAAIITAIITFCRKVRYFASSAALAFGGTFTSVPSPFVHSTSCVAITVMAARPV